jgi:hypothetical protein
MCILMTAEIYCPVRHLEQGGDLCTVPALHQRGHRSVSDQYKKLSKITT